MKYIEPERRRSPETAASPGAPGALCQIRDDLVRVRIGQRLQQNAVDDGEDGGVGADADGEREERDGGEERPRAGAACVGRSERRAHSSSSQGRPR